MGAWRSISGVFDRRLVPPLQNTETNVTDGILTAGTNLAFQKGRQKTDELKVDGEVWEIVKIVCATR